MSLDSTWNARPDKPVRPPGLPTLDARTPESRESARSLTETVDEHLARKYADKPAPDCRKDVADAWRNCPILADQMVDDIYNTALGQLLRPQDQKQVGRVVSLAYYLGRENERRPVDSDQPIGPDRRIDLNGSIYTIAEALAMWQKDLNESEARAKRIETLEALLRDIRVCLGDGLIKDRINDALG